MSCAGGVVFASSHRPPRANPLATPVGSEISSSDISSSSESDCDFRRTSELQLGAAVKTLDAETQNKVVIGSKVLPNHCDDIRKYVAAARCTSHAPVNIGAAVRPRLCAVSQGAGRAPARLGQDCSRAAGATCGLTRGAIPCMGSLLSFVVKVL